MGGRSRFSAKAARQLAGISLIKTARGVDFKKSKQTRPLIKEDIIRSAWDDKHSYHENIDKLNIKDVITELAANKERKVGAIPYADRRVIERLCAKHGEDFTAMEWDRKLNIFQWKASSLRCKWNAHNRWKEQQKNDLKNKT